MYENPEGARLPCYRRPWPEIVRNTYVYICSKEFWVRFSQLQNILINILAYLLFCLIVFLFIPTFVHFSQSVSAYFYTNFVLSCAFFLLFFIVSISFQIAATKPTIPVKAAIVPKTTDIIEVTSFVVGAAVVVVILRVTAKINDSTN